MYKDGMSVSEVTCYSDIKAHSSASCGYCYSDTCATYSCSRPVTHRHVYTSRADFHFDADSSAAHRYADSSTACGDTNSDSYAYISSKHSVRYSEEFRLRTHDGYGGCWWKCYVEFCPRHTHNNRYRFRVVEQREQEQWVILTHIQFSRHFHLLAQSPLLNDGYGNSQLVVRILLLLPTTT